MSGADFSGTNLAGARFMLSK
ncbi:MAG: pentapeptide repeat-containing protein [Chloroflexi bacterium]|nr:pentapeptide repeat-containing protein [Chloroflexota bacterium]